jgi:hypothetical protein
LGHFPFPYASDGIEKLCKKPPLRPHRNHTTCRKGGILDDRDPFHDPRDREPRQTRLAREGHSQPPVEGKVAEEAREWARRLGIGSGELAEILRKGEGFTNEHKAKIQDSRPSAPCGSCNARAWTQVTTASNATSKCTITRSGTRRAAVRNSEANITAIYCIVNFIVLLGRLDGGATSEVSLPGIMRSILPSAVGANISAIPYRRDPEVRYRGIFRVCGYTACRFILHDQSVGVSNLKIP